VAGDPDRQDLLPIARCRGARRDQGQGRFLMPAPPLAVLGVGLVSGLGLTAAESCAAIRCGINNFNETRFIASSGGWLVGSAVELEQPWRGIVKLAKMIAHAVRDCLAAVPGLDARQVPLLLCTAEDDRPGRFDNLDRALLDKVDLELGVALHPQSRVIPQGRVGGAVALLQARRLLEERRCTHVIVAGADTFLVGATLAAFDEADRLLRRDNSNGFIPGEAAGAVLLGRYEEGSPAPLLCRGLGFAREPAPLSSGKPLRADGLVQAIRGALDESGIALKDCNHRIADVSGEQYRFKEAALAIMRLLRERKVLFLLWHPADCIGEVGAAVLPAMLAMLYWGARKDYLPGPMFLGHLGNDDDKRAAFIAQATIPQSLALEIPAEAAFGLKRRSAH
jgi:3-oxoacyl-[acyl-carrier-protein] synthase I